MSSVPSIKLNDGNAIPQLGFGVYQIILPVESTSLLNRRMSRLRGRVLRVRKTLPVFAPSSGRFFAVALMNCTLVSMVQR